MTTNVNLGFVAAAAGTVDAITATYSPAPSALVDKMLVWFRATGANTSSTPTFSPNGLTARTIVKQGGQPLVAGDIPRAGAIMEMVYDATNTRWELVNPAHSEGYKKYVALLTQSGTSAPTATVGENNIGAIVWSRAGAGVYDATLAGAFPNNKCYGFATPTVETGFLRFERQNDNVMRFYVDNSSAAATDDALANTPIEIRVYY